MRRTHVSPQILLKTSGSPLRGWKLCALGLACLLPVSLWAAGINFGKSDDMEEDAPARKTESAPTEKAEKADKAARTPAFCQKDEEAGFADGGSNYCAPTSISNGLIYLAQARGLTKLVSGRSHEDQIELIKELAEAMNTDPKEGTNPDKILTGLKEYVEGRGLQFKRLEVATWRKLSSANKACLVGAKPSLDWMRKAALDPDCVEIFNVGWYREENAGYSRKGGHWITVVGAGSGATDFAVHNPLLASETQKVKSGVTLTKLDHEFKFVNADGDEAGDMNGYFRVDGPGLPFGGKTAAAVLDSVIVFSVQK